MTALTLSKTSSWFLAISRDTVWAPATAADDSLVSADLTLSVATEVSTDVPVSAEPCSLVSAETALSDAALSLTADLMAALSPRLMMWSDKVWLVDMAASLSYWQTLSKAQHWSEDEFWPKLLQAAHPEAASWRCVLAPHPWQAVLGLAFMEERGLTGFFNLRDSFAKSWLQSLSWSTWFECVESLATHLAATGTRGFRADTFRQQKNALERAVTRFGVTSLSSWQHVEPSSVNRRFGRWFALIWDWQKSTTTPAAAPKKKAALRLAQRPLFADTATGLSTEIAVADRSALAVFEETFPWCSWVWAQGAQVQRHLDYVVSTWDHIEPLWLEDFTRLTQHSAYPMGHHVVGLQWRLTRHDLTCLEIPITFRHPYNPFPEAPHFRTALLQTYYQFCAAQSVAEREADDGLVSPILSWTLSLVDTMVFPMALKLLFDSGQSDLAALLRLENLLPVPLLAFELKPEFTPEGSYQERPVGEPDTVPPVWHKAALHSLLAASGRRPLFIQKEPQAFSQNGQSSRAWRYLERCSEPWWQFEAKVGLGASEGSPCGAERDYYRMMERSGEHYWVYRHSSGEWFIHGLFS